MANNKFNTMHGTETLWLAVTPTQSVTEVCFYHSIQCLPEAEFVKESLYALQRQCACHCSALSISTQQNAGGQVVTTLCIPLSVEEACVSIASAAQQHSASRQVVITVKDTVSGDMTISDASNQHWNSRA